MGVREGWPVLRTQTSGFRAQQMTCVSVAPGHGKRHAGGTENENPTCWGCFCRERADKAGRAGVSLRNPSWEKSLSACPVA